MSNFTKNDYDSVINNALEEVKIYMQSICKTTEILDKKAYNIITICLTILLGVCGFIFTSFEKIDITIIVASFILCTGSFISIIILYYAFKARNFYIYGDLMKDIKSEDVYYHDEKGFKIYLIDIYQNKSLENLKTNNLKGNYINYAMFVAILSALTSVMIVLLSKILILI